MKKYILFPTWIAMLAMLVLSGCSHTSYLEASDDAVSVNDAVEEAGREADTGADEQIYVQVAGAVNSPGVYPFAVGARVYEAVDAAGGLAADADEGELNLAAVLSDGQKLYIYTEEERAAMAEAQAAAGGSGTVVGGESTSAAGVVNVNTADAAQLMTLSGIGASKAAAIIAYREAHGRFTKTEDLMNVDGIGAGTFEKLKDQITI